MIPTNLSSKGQLTIPKRFRKRMKLSGRRRVVIEQLKDGTVVVRPVRSLMDLAGSMTPARPLLSPKAERRATQLAVGKERGARKG